FVKKGIKIQIPEKKSSFTESMKEGWDAIRTRQGVLILILVSAAITMFIGIFQILAEPLVLAFADAKTLGITETICAAGMLVSSIFLGVRGIKKKFVKTLYVSLALAGVFIFGFGLKENIIMLICTGFGFFVMLPFANNCLDYLIRTNIPDELQGRAWGFIGFISQIGYVIAFSLSGVISDLLGSVLGIGVGRGAALVISSSGVLLVVLSVILYRIKSIHMLESASVTSVET
ncbi:MAG: MFS transporter, partial [Eubacterium sp.]|nr:MFS transporter [Eubacterium sp.]